MATLRQHDLLMQLLRLAREQGEALQQRGLDQFLQLAERRDRIVAELRQSVDAQLPSNVLPFPTLRTTAEASDLRDAVQSLISSIAAQDTANLPLLQRLITRLDEARSQLVHAGSNAADDDGSTTAGPQLQRAMRSRLARRSAREGGQADIERAERAERVARIKAAVAAGAYTVDLEQLAARLLDVL